MVVHKTQIAEIQTRTRILDAAEELFANNGYRGASVKRISAKAGVTGAMINYYFLNKEKLYHAVLDRIAVDISKMVSEAVATGLPPAQRLELFFGWFFDYAASNPNFTKLTRMGAGGLDSKYFMKNATRIFKPMLDTATSFFSNELGVKKQFEIDYPHLLLSIFGMTITYFSDPEIMTLLLGRDALSSAEIAKRRECLLEIIFRTLGIQRPFPKREATTEIYGINEKRKESRK